MFRQIKTIIKIFKFQFTNVNDNSKRIINFLENYFDKSYKKNQYLLVDYFESYEAAIASAYFINVFCKKNECSPIIFSDKKNILFNKEWRKIYKSIGVIKFIYIFFSPTFFFEKLNFFNRFKKKKEIELYLSSIKKKSDLLNFKYKDIIIGGDICDEYLYTRMTHTIDLKDKYLKFVILDFINTIDFWISYFKKNKVIGISLSHVNVRLTAIVGKVATKFYNIPVYSATCHYIKKSIDLSDHKKYIKNDFEKMPKLFSKLSNREKKSGLDWAKNRLDKRFSGEVGVDMHYSNESAFHNKRGEKVLKENDKLKAIICTHQFYDNPHAYGGLIFVDFYEWLTFIAKKTEKSNFDWYIKNHPDTDTMTKKIVEDFVKEYSHIKLINEKISFLQLRDEGIKIVFTCYGTIGYEAPLLGMNVINADINHPHSAYNFNFSPQNIEQFSYMIDNLDKLEIDIDKNEIYEYYFVSNNLQYNDSLIFNSYKKAKQKEKENQENMLDIYLEEFDKNKHLNILKNLNKII